MLKTHMTACLLATALMAVPALAQTSTTAPATNTAPVTTPAGPAGSTMGANPNATMGANSGASTTAGSTVNAGNATVAGGTFMTRREPGMYRASELIGKDVRGANNEDIGEVGDVLIDRNGQVKAVVLDIGGFLGIGETHVAIPMQQIQFRSNQQAANAGQQNANTTGAVGSAAGNAATTGATGQNTSAGMGNNQNQAGAGAGSDRGGPDMVVLVMTKDQLRNAPKFEDNGRGSNTGTNTGSRSGTTTGTGTTAPRP